MKVKENHGLTKGRGGDADSRHFQEIVLMS
jgi:hypothetical protein